MTFFFYYSYNFSSFMVAIILCHKIKFDPRITWFLFLLVLLIKLINLLTELWQHGSYFLWKCESCSWTFKKPNTKCHFCLMRQKPNVGTNARFQTWWWRGDDVGSPCRHETKIRIVTQSGTEDVRPSVWQLRLGLKPGEIRITVSFPLG